MKQRNPMTCTLASCDRTKANHVDLLCLAHWARVPRRLKVAFWAAPKIRSAFDRSVAIMAAAEDILTWLEKNAKVALPPQVKILAPESQIEKAQDPTKRIIYP